MSWSLVRITFFDVSRMLVINCLSFSVRISLKISMIVLTTTNDWVIPSYVTVGILDVITYLVWRVLVDGYTTWMSADSTWWVILKVNQTMWILICLSLEMLDLIVNVGFIILNIIYTIWGWVSPNDSCPLEELVQKLKFFKGFVKYSDLIFMSARIGLMLLVRFLCCRYTTEIKSTTESV